ncbi:MAG: hypothetical protein ACE5J3_09450 [Methanosarcinales archaeon]
MRKYKVLAIDLDGVVAENTRPYRKAKLIKGAKEAIDKFIKEGWKILLFTSRFQRDEQLTKEWLEEKGIKYDKIIFGKPYYSIYIDDKAVKFENWRQIENEVK